MDIIDHYPDKCSPDLVPSKTGREQDQGDQCRSP
jgi:hypothetical protein